MEEEILTLATKPSRQSQGIGVVVSWRIHLGVGLVGRAFVASGPFPPRSERWISIQVGLSGEMEFTRGAFRARTHQLIIVKGQATNNMKRLLFQRVREQKASPPPT